MGTRRRLRDHRNRWTATTEPAAATNSNTHTASTADNTTRGRVRTCPEDLSWASSQALRRSVRTCPEGVSTKMSADPLM